MEREAEVSGRHALGRVVSGWVEHFATAPLSQADVDELADGALAVIQATKRASGDLDWLEADNFAAALRLRRQNNAK